MATAVSLDGIRMFVSSTANRGVVDAETHIAFRQRGPRVIGTYQGGGSGAASWLERFPASS
jgi:hypothetical protein